jgi:hypothetical protein
VRTNSEQPAAPERGALPTIPDAQPIFKRKADDTMGILLTRTAWMRVPALNATIPCPFHHLLILDPARLEVGREVAAARAEKSYEDYVRGLVKKIGAELGIGPIDLTKTTVLPSGDRAAAAFVWILAEGDPEVACGGVGGFPGDSGTVLGVSAAGEFICCCISLFFRAAWLRLTAPVRLVTRLVRGAK